MPKEQVFFEQRTGDRRIEVLKTYDQNYARDVFDNMDRAAQTHLRMALKIDEMYEAAEIPEVNTHDAIDFLWEELSENSREDGSQLSFFIVTETSGMISSSLYVSPDWPSAEEFAKKYVAAFQSH